MIDDLLKICDQTFSLYFFELDYIQSELAHPAWRALRRQESTDSIYFCPSKYRFR